MAFAVPLVRSFIHSPTIYWASALCPALGNQPKQIKYQPLELMFQGELPRPGTLLLILQHSTPVPSSELRSKTHHSRKPGQPHPFPASPPPALCTLTLLHIIFLDNSQLLCNISPVCSHPVTPTCKCLESRNQVFCFFQIPPKQDVTEPGSFAPCTASQELRCWGCQQRRDTFTRQPSVRTGEQISNLPPQWQGARGIYGIKLRRGGPWEHGKR